MEQRLILTLAQARELRRTTQLEEANPDSSWVWPGKWTPIMNAPVRLTSERKEPVERLEAALTMYKWGCGEEQISLQLSWAKVPMKRLAKLSEEQPLAPKTPLP